MCDVVQTVWLFCPLGKDYEIKTVLTSLVLENYRQVPGKTLLSKHLSSTNGNTFFKIFSQTSEWKPQRILMVWWNLRVAQG